MKWIFTVSSVTLFLFVCLGQTALTVDAVQIYPTFQHIGIHCSISGDNNLNSSLNLSYRRAGTNDLFKPGAKTMRAHPGAVVDGSPLNDNYHAGSVMFLDPASSYQIRIEILDLDGGNYLDTITAVTNDIMTLPAGATDRFVIPGNGGGAGTKEDPYRGLQSAADQALPGDVFKVVPGTYSPFELNTDGSNGNPIVFVSTELHKAVIEGNNTNRGIVTLGVYNDSLEHIIIDGFLIQNGRWGIDAQNTQHITIRNNKLRDVDYGFVNRRGNGWEHHQHIVNNHLTGRTPWPQLNGEIPGERGIDIRGSINVVNNNFITNFGDGISTNGPLERVSYGLDIYNNDIRNIVDDPLEVDGNISNTRVYRNRVYNSRMGISLAPIYGGPCYVFRNEFFNLETSSYKMNRSPSGIVICHNTSVKVRDGMTSSAGWKNTYFRSNAMLATRYCFEEYGVVSGSIDDWDYNAYFTTRTGTSGDEWFKYDNVRYEQISDLKTGTGLEMHGIQIQPSDFVSGTIPSQYGTEYFPSERDFIPSSDSELINSGDPGLDNLNNPFVQDGMPDIGALEYGQPYPEYGPNFELLSDIKILLGSDHISVYPNPSSQFLIIEGLLDDFDIRLTDVQGVNQIIIEDNDGKSYVDVSGLGSGIYFVEISHQTISNMYVKKMVKQ